MTPQPDPKPSQEGEKGEEEEEQILAPTNGLEGVPSKLTLEADSHITALYMVRASVQCVCVPESCMMLFPLQPLHHFRGSFFQLSLRMICLQTCFQPSSSHKHTSVHGKLCLLMQ